MTRLNDNQINKINRVKELFERITPTIEAMTYEYEYAVYVTKQPVIEAIKEAHEDAGVPMSRIVEALSMGYPRKLQDWMSPTEGVYRKLEGPAKVETTVPEEDIPEQYKEVIDEVESVTRDSSTGVFEVLYKNKTYQIPAFGSDAEPWASRQNNVPEEVYELITKSFPSFVVLDEDLDEEDY